VKKYILPAALLFIASSANAQIQRRGTISTEPSMWVDLGIGVYSANGISDGSTNSTWDFGNGTDWQYRAALEKTFQNQC